MRLYLRSLPDAVDKVVCAETEAGEVEGEATGDPGVGVGELVQPRAVHQGSLLQYTVESILINLFHTSRTL